MCNFLEYKGTSVLHPRIPFLFSFDPPRTDGRTTTDSKVVYRRYASLFFIAGCASTDNELITLEIVHRYVEQMDKYYGNVCELDIIFNFQKAYFILDELLLAGEMQESSKKNVLRCISQQDSLEDMEVSAVLLISSFLSHPPSNPSRSARANAPCPRLRKMWSPRSCSKRDSCSFVSFLSLLLPASQGRT